MRAPFELGLRPENEKERPNGVGRLETTECME